MRITDLRANHVIEPLGFQLKPLSLSWRVEDANGAKRQKWARVQIRESGGNVYGNGETVYDSGKTVYGGSKTVYDSGEDVDVDSLNYPVKVDLKPRTRYDWSVEVKADNGDTATGESWFETGKMDEAWSAKWITPEMDPSVPPILCQAFSVANPAKNARLYICGLGVYEVYLNGKKVGDEYLAPGYHSYDFHLQVQTYDVGEYLVAGENTVQIWLGDGWFRGRFGFDGGYTNIYGDKCYAIAELYCGNELVLATDDTWKCVPSPVVFSAIYDGEIYDAAKEANDSYIPVREEIPSQCGMYAKDEPLLCDRYSLPIAKKETFAPVEVIHTPKDETVLDFGQSLTGWVEFDCDLPEGMQIRLSASEILQDGCFFRENLRTAKAEYIFRSAGKPAHARPHFTFYGFRYMKVEYLDAEGNVVDIASEILNGLAWNFVAYHLRSDFDQIGSIVTASEKVNKLFSNALWGQKDNFLDVPTDCPQRDERMGWTGDAQIFSETACYNMYMPAFYRKYLWDMRAEQSILDGSVPNVVPRLKHGMVAEHGSCPWADSAVVIPWNVYEHYGDRTLLAECYPGMKAWVDCERKKEEAIPGAHLVKDGFHFADWLALDNPQPGPFGATDPLYIASAYYYWCAKHVALAAEALSRAGNGGEVACLAEDERKCAASADDIQENTKYAVGEREHVGNEQEYAETTENEQEYAGDGRVNAKVAEDASEYAKYAEDARIYGELADEILAAIQEKYFDGNGICVCGTQTGSAIAVMFGLNPTQEATQQEGDLLAKRVQENGGHLNTGFVGTTMLCPALTATGHHEIAMSLLLNEDYPGWLYCVNLGATTIWERWNSVEPDGHLNPEGMNSLNHYSYGSIEAWMYRYVCGISPVEPGFREAVIAPHPDVRLGHAAMKLETAAGTYVSSWECMGDGSVRYEVEVPFGAVAEFCVDGMETRTLETGSYVVTVRPMSNR